MSNILTIGIGAAPNDTTGDPLRTAMTKVMTAVNGLASSFNGPAAPISAMTFQTWFDTSTTPPTLRYYDGTQWVGAATLNQSTHTYLSLASPGGSVGGDLTGTLPNPTISALAVTNAKMAAGAASANVGALSGDLTGSLPTQTIAKIQGTTVSGVTGTGNSVFSISPLITGILTINGAGNNSTISAVDSGTATSFTTPAFNFNTVETFASFSSASTHFGFVIQAAKAAVGANSTGSRQAFTCQQLGAGGTSTDYFTAGFQLASPTAGTNNNAGNFTANNPYVNIPTGMTPTTAIGEEIDITTKSNVASIRQGLRIVDIGSTGSAGGNLDSGIGISSSGIGFVHSLFIGDTANAGFPVSAGGDIINTVSSSVVLDSFINFSNITGVPTKAPIVLGANNKGIWWGPAKAGGSIVSETGVAGPDIVLGNSLVAFRFAGTIATYNVPGGSIYVPITIANLPGAPFRGQIAFIHDTIGNAAPAYHVIVAAGGATTVDGLAYYDGAAWRWA